MIGQCSTDSTEASSFPHSFQFSFFLVTPSVCEFKGDWHLPPTIKWKLSGDKDSQGHVFPRQRWIHVLGFNINIFQKVMENTKIADMLITSHWWPLYLFAFGTSSRVGEPDFSLTCCCPLSLYPTSLMQISTAGGGGKCLDCIQAFFASTLPFSLALVTIFTFDWSCCQRFYHMRMYLSNQFKLNDIQSRPCSTR